MAIEVATPKTSDGKVIFIPVLFRGDLHSMYMGFGDDVANGTRFQGTQLAKKITAVADTTTTVEWQYINYIYLAGGMVVAKEAEVGDYADYDIVAPASPATENTGSGDYAKINIVTGLNLFVPAGTPGAGGADWDLDLEETKNANVDFTKVVPVPAPQTELPNGEVVGTGFFDWDQDTNEVTLNTGGTGFYNLFDAEVSLAHFARLTLLGCCNFDMRTPSQKPKKLLPHWLHRVKIYNVTDRSGANTPLEVAWNIHYAREDAT